MKFNIQSKLLFTHLQAVSKVVNSKNTISILDNFLFNLSGNMLVITASDQETTLTTQVEVANAEGSGKFAAGVKELLDMLKELPDQGLAVEINDQNLAININYLNGEFNFIGINGNEFPTKAQSEEEVKTFTLPAEKVARGIQQTVFAVGTESLRPMMMGIYWDIKPDMIVFVASDSYKLVRYRQSNVAPNFERSFILPAKPAGILASIISHTSDENINITLDESSATFENADYQLSCRFINGRYPNYNSVIPEDNPYTMAVDRMTLLNAVRRVAVFANVGGLVRLDLKATEVVLTAQDVDHSTAAEETIACEYNGEPMNIGFKSADVIDVINNINSDGVYLKLLDPARAGVFVPSEQEAGEDLVVLQMPMMI